MLCTKRQIWWGGCGWKIGCAQESEASLSHKWNATQATYYNEIINAKRKWKVGHGDRVDRFVSFK